MMPVRLIALASILLLVGCGRGKDRFDSPTKDILTNATKVEVFRIAGEEHPDQPLPAAEANKRIGGFRVIAQGPDLGNEFAYKLAEVLFDKTTWTEDFAKCFWPGIAFRIWKNNEAVDVLICFKCDNLYCGPSSDKGVRENASFWHSPRRTDLLRLAKEAFPDDQEIQALEDK